MNELFNQMELTMQANWSLILNVLLLVGVVITIGRLMKARRQSLSPMSFQPSLGKAESRPHFDEIIAVRKVNSEAPNDSQELDDTMANTPSLNGSAVELEKEDNKPTLSFNDAGPSVMMFLLAKENRQLAGYELLQTVLAAGLRFGEGNLFHRHQQTNGHGPVLCSLAAATATGIFDLQNIGAFSVRGLCLFMRASGNPTIDKERFAIMFDTAKCLRDGLDCHLLDDKKQSLSQASFVHYRNLLNLAVEDELLESIDNSSSSPTYRGLSAVAKVTG